MKNRTIIAFDFGTSSIGMAIAQEIIASATPLTAIKVKNGQPKWIEIEKVFKTWKPDLAIIGLPLNMNGTEQLISKKARNFACSLYYKFNIKIKLHDERLTTVEARTQLFNKGGYKALNKRKIDSISAMIILESWLNIHL